MAKIDAINQKIIAQSVQTKPNQTDVPKKSEDSEKKESSSVKSKNYKIAATAVASIAIAGILIANRNRIGNLFKGAGRNSEKASSIADDASKTIGKENISHNVDTSHANNLMPKADGKTQTFNAETPVQKLDDPSKTVNSDNKKTEFKSKEIDEADKGFNFSESNEVIYNNDDVLDEDIYTPPVPKLIDKIVSYDENYEKLRREKEAPIMDKVKEIYARFRDDKESAPEFNEDRPINVLFPKHVAPSIKPDLRELENDDFDAVMSFLENYQYNAKMRAGIDVSDVDEVKRIKRLIDEAEPLEKETFVYRAIRTHELWGNHNEYEFAKDMEIGDTLKDRAFVATSRSYDLDIAGGDPKNWDKRLQDYGLIMRIRLPKGTKGLDCRRCSMMDSDRGVNVTYILPPGAEFKIRAYDAPRKILSCDYILPNS